MQDPVLHFVIMLLSVFCFGISTWGLRNDTWPYRWSFLSAGLFFMALHFCLMIKP